MPDELNERQNKAVEDEKFITDEVAELKEFMHGGDYADLETIEQGLLIAQLMVMQNLLDLLRRRIETF